MTPCTQPSPDATKPTAQEREERMRAYLQATRPSFVQAVINSQTLGQAANGVLAGPIVKK